MGILAPQRIVVWVDQSSDGAVTARWAAHHAEGRRLPLHLVVFPRARALNGDWRAQPSGDGERDPAAEAALALRYVVRRIFVRYQHLKVTTQIVQDGSVRPDREMLEHGDILVTGPAGYVDLAEHGMGDDVAGSVGVPLVVVPVGAAAGFGARRRVLLLTGAHLSEPAAFFAFEVAADLCAGVEVKVSPDGAVFGGDFWIGRPEDFHRDRRRLLELMEGAVARYPEVAWSSATLCSELWRTFRVMTRAAHLTVLPSWVELQDEDVRRLLGIATSPLVFVPARTSVEQDAAAYA